MPDGQVLEFTRVTKRFNDVTAVSDFSARVEPGVVTAFLGPNGAGKTTTLRILLGQVRANSGTATIGGVAFPDLRHPLRTIGSVLEETVYRPRRSAGRQLTIAAKANGIPLSRVDEVLSLVGLEHESEGRIGSFSLGMRQRLSVAHALLGDPGALVFDEPANGLDPEGIRWMRLLMRRLADEGRTVLVSSHVLSEIEQVADHVLVLSKGQLMLSSGIEKLADPSAGSVVVDAADRAALKAALSAAGLEVEVLRSGLTVRGSNAGKVGAIAASAGIALTTLVQRGPTLEDVFIELVRGGTLAPHAIAAASQFIAPEAEPSDAAIDAAPATTVIPAVVEPAVATSPETVNADDGSDDAEDAPADDASNVDEGAEPLEADASETGPAADAPVDTADSDAAQTDAAAADAAQTDAAAADAAEAKADDAAYAAAAARDVEHAAAELGYAADASDANDAEDAADVASEAAESHDQAGHDVDAASEGEAATSEEGARPSFDDILFGTVPVNDAEPSADADTDSGAENGSAPTDEGLDEHSGVEFFTEVPASEESVSGDVADPAAGEADAADDDPRSAAVTSMLAAAARAYYDDEPKDYPLGVSDASESDEAQPDEAQPDDAAAEPSENSESDVQDATDAQEHHEGENHGGEHHHHDSEHHQHHDGEHHQHHDGEHHQS
ncbi:ATP-binding cassette domain-containing protein [Microbacterium phyllosphaerae]|uniref:ATP-binding cassette domain-containing protein n=1 Tax=Microbacterium phyllosphaerae TaxID=124798 RepID=UPI00216A0A5D|nr:ATP-binding cassette domain-containing protein [Microbacterium phyllosphaerae]MCS3443403.1 ABC-type multidrug transport system ATPase subunit [Microbacterium phyllosphaerae]